VTAQKEKPLLLVCLTLLGFFYLGCHRIDIHSREGRQLPQAFRTPQATFETWVAATLSGDIDSIKDCYWEGLSPEELSAWLRENTRKQALNIFKTAQFINLTPISPVEVNFSFSLADGEQELSGVMVRTKMGWKIQRW
jgi:hypothetical protein